MMMAMTMMLRRWPRRTVELEESRGDRNRECEKKKNQEEEEGATQEVVEEDMAERRPRAAEWC